MGKLYTSVCLALVLALVLQISMVFMVPLVSAIDLHVKEEEISDIAIIELDEPAVFELTITNNEESTGSFQIYSLVGRVDLEPTESFVIDGNSTKKITLEAYPRNTPGVFSFEYKIKDAKDNIQTENLVVNIVNLADAFNFYAENINPDSQTAIVHFDNKGGYKFDHIEAEFSCVFFEKDLVFSLDPHQTKQFEIDIDKDQAKDQLAGPYILNANIAVEGYSAKPNTIIRFTEQSGLDTVETTEGLLLRRHEITKTNRGNLPLDVETVIRKNVFLGWITTFNLVPTNQDTVGKNTFYIFEKRLAPGEELKVIEKTNWWIVILIVAAAIAIIYLARKFSITKLKLIKRTTFVKTKGGEFALKISLVVKAKDFVERIKVVDKLPGMVKLYERYGTISPDKVDEQNKRIEWNIESLDKGEERVFSYIIYSKMGIVGRFELPEAKAFFDFKGKMHEMTSNKAVFVNEPASRKPDIRKAIDEMF